MNFNQWLNESTLQDLYQSAVDAFPGTRRRQHAVGPIKIEQLSIIPYKGMKTIYLKTVARNENREYTPVILFKNVTYYNEGGGERLQVTADDGNVYIFDPLSLTEKDALVRCNCKDFFWRFNYYNHLDEALYGRKRTKYEGAYRINPKEMPGLCKHLMKMAIMLKDSGFLTS